MWSRDKRLIGPSGPAGCQAHSERGKHSFWAALVVGALAGSCQLARAEIIESIAAKINGEIVFESELDQLVRLKWMLDSRQPVETIPEDEYTRLRFEAFKQRTREILLSQECESILKERGYDKRLSEREMNRIAGEIFERYRARFGSEQAMTEHMERNGLTEESLRAECLHLARQQYWDRVARQLARERASPVSESEIEGFKAAHPEEWRNYERVQLSHILLRVPEDMPADQEEQIRERAETIALRAQAGADFAALAREFSEHEGTREQGGLLGELPRGEVYPEFDPLFDLPINKPVGPIRTKLGYHIVLVHNRASLADFLQGQKIQQALDGWIEEIVHRPETEILYKGDLLEDLVGEPGGG